MLLSSTRKDWLGNVRGDVLAGIVVALALINLSIVFANYCVAKFGQHKVS